MHWFVFCSIMFCIVIYNTVFFFFGSINILFNQKHNVKTKLLRSILTSLSKYSLHLREIKLLFRFKIKAFQFYSTIILLFYSYFYYTVLIMSSIFWQNLIKIFEDNSIAVCSICGAKIKIVSSKFRSYTTNLCTSILKLNAAKVTTSL